ncbi:hypothetical protein ACKFKG_26860 [Phormidesmis sp. 146-35]
MSEFGFIIQQKGRSLLSLGSDRLFLLVLLVLSIVPGCEQAIAPQAVAAFVPNPNPIPERTGGAGGRLTDTPPDNLLAKRASGRKDGGKA